MLFLDAIIHFVRHWIGLCESWCAPCLVRDHYEIYHGESDAKTRDKR